MRILLATHAFLPRSVAGVEVYTSRLAAALQQLGHTVRVVTAVHDLTLAPHSVHERRVGTLDVVEIANPHLEGGLEGTYQVPAIDRALERVFSDFRPDCVHAQHILNLSTGMIGAGRRVGAKVLLTLHDYWLSCPRDGLRMRADGVLCASVDHQICASCIASSPQLLPSAQRAVTRIAQRLGLGGALHAVHRRAPRLAAFLLRTARRTSASGSVDLRPALDQRAAHLRERVAGLDAIVAPTDFVRARALEWGAAPDLMRLLSYGAIHGPTQPRPARARRRLGYLGTLAPHKGVHVLVEALRDLEDSSLSLDIFGSERLDPEYSHGLRRLAAGDSRIRFRGPVPPDRQSDVWSAVDALVVPSLWWENSPLTVLEALAAGIPVVASRTGGVPEIVPAGAGVLFEPGRVAELRGILIEVAAGRLLGGSKDALPLKTSLEGARELAALYSELCGTEAAG